MNILRAVRILAAAEVARSAELQSDEYHLRRILRAYSREFHTPLHVVETLPMAQVLRHYYESDYETRMEGEKPEVANLMEEFRILGMTEADHAAAKARRDAAAAAAIVADRRFFDDPAREMPSPFKTTPDELLPEFPPVPAEPQPPASEPEDLDLSFDDEPPRRA